MNKFLYVTLCLFVPPIWGLISYWIIELVGKRRGGRGAGSAQPPGGEGRGRETGGAP